MLYLEYLGLTNLSSDDFSYRNHSLLHSYCHGHLQVFTVELAYWKQHLATLQTSSVQQRNVVTTVASTVADTVMLTSSSTDTFGNSRLGVSFPLIVHSWNACSTPLVDCWSIHQTKNCIGLMSRNGDVSSYPSCPSFSSPFSLFYFLSCQDQIRYLVRLGMT